MPKRVTVTLGDKIYADLEKYCRDEISKSSVVNIALKELLGSHNFENFIRDEKNQK